MGGGSALQIGFENQDNNCKITDCTFNNNYVAPDNYGHAGVACLRRGVSFINCNFTNNHAYDVGVLGFHDGGSVIKCKFYNNFAIEMGGVLKFDSTNQSIIVENSYFENNTAKQGGAIYFFSDGSIKNCSFVRNTAKQGGALYSNGNTIIVEYCNFTNNLADYGGAIYNDGFLNSKNCQYQSNKAKSALYLTTNNPVKCSDNAIIKATLEGGNNVINAIWSKNTVTINDKSINPNNRISSQTVTLDIEGKIYNSITNNNGEAIFKFNTINFKVKNYKCKTSLKNSNNYFESSQECNLEIITKIVIKTKIKNKKKIKKVKKYQAYIPFAKYVKVKYKIKYIDNKYNEYGYYNGVKKIKKYDFKWKNVSKKSLKTKYKWYKSKYYWVTKYKATKIKYKWLNGKLVKKSVNKKYKFYKKSKYKSIRKKDWSIYVLPSVDCESDNKQIIKLSKKIIKKEAKKLKKPVSKLTDSQKAHAILYYVQKQIKYDKYGDTRKGAVKTLKDKKGNCADQTHLSIALLRAANIPAKYETKIVKMKGDEEGHAWHLAYFKNKWWAGESTDQYSCPKYGKSKWLNKVYIKAKAVDNLHKISHQFISKYVKYKGLWCQIHELHLINNKWDVYHGNNWNGGTLTKIQYTVGGFK